MKKAIMIYGQPGAGKGTQANLLSWSKGFFHFDTGKELEWLIHNPAKQSDPLIQRERVLFDGGQLNTPSWVLKMVSEKAEEIAKAGLGIVFSGSPRTLFEAFGDEKNTGLIEILEKAYGKENLHFILLKVHPDSSVFRNTNRKICSVCKTPVLANHQSEECPICGGKLYKRVLDTPEKMKIRLEEYENRTKPILAELEKRGHKISEIDGEPAPHEVHKTVLQALNL